MQNEKIILYGIGSKMLRNRFWYKENFNIVAFSDSNPDKECDIPFSEIPYILPKDIIKLNFDYIVVCSVYADEIIEDLTLNNNIDINKVISDHAIYMKYFFINKKSYGEKNQDKFIVVIGREGKTYGLFWYYNYYIQYIREISKRGYYPVIDMKNFINIYLESEEIGHVNAWEYYFEQPVSIGLEEAYESFNVIQVPDSNFISDSLYTIDRVYSDTKIRKEYYEIGKKYIRINSKVNSIIENEFHHLLKPIQDKGHKILGTLYRGTDFINIKPYLHKIQPSIEQFIAKTKELMNEWNYDYVYMASDDEVAISKMKEVFKKQFICYERKRFFNTAGKRLAFVAFDREKDRYIKGLDYLIEIALLARCDSLIAGKAGGTIGALILNGCQYEHEYLFELGLYGIDDKG